MDLAISRRGFLAGAATFAASAAFSLPCRAFADDDQASDGAIVILHTNDVHCAAGETGADGTTPLGYAALASYAADRRGVFGTDNVTLVDAGDAVQGNVMGTLTRGQALVDIMNECGYEYAIPGNHEFDFGMTQFNHLVDSANAKYLSCNFTDKRVDIPTLMFDPYAIKTYQMPGGGEVKIAYVGVTTPSTLTASTPRSFWRSDDDHTCVYGFCEDENGHALATAVQQAVDGAKTEGADYVVLLAHLGQTGEPAIWRSDAIVSRCVGIDVVIDGHSHEEYVQVVPDAAGRDVIITQTGTKFSSVGQVVINPSTATISASTPNFEATLLREARAESDPSYVQAATFGRDTRVQSVIESKAADVRTQTGTVVGTSEVDLFAYEDDGYTWAVRSRETNLGDFVADAYLYYASNNGIVPDMAFVNGGGVRTNLRAGDVTRADLINVNPFNNQLCYTEVLGQDLLDALEVSVSALPEPSGDFLQVSEGLAFTVRTDIDTPVVLDGGRLSYIDASMERRVRRATLHDVPIDPSKTYTLVCHSYYLIDGGGAYSMLNRNPVTLLGLDNEALMEYMQLNLNGTIGQSYAGSAGLGRITMQNGPDPKPEPKDDPSSDVPASSNTKPTGSNAKKQNPGPLPATGDAAGYGAAAMVGAALVIGAGAAAMQAE